MARVRLADVARDAGVSIGAASDALSGKNQIPETTRQRVRDAAARLGYVPNPVARAMRMGHLPLIGLVIGSLRRPDEYTPHRAYWGELIGAATLAAADRGYGIVVLPGLADSPFDASALAAVAVISSAPDQPDLDLALGLGVPVLSDSDTAHPSAIHAEVPYTDTVVAALTHLAERGSTRPALLCADLGTYFSIAVIDAYLDWCRQHDNEPVVLDSTPGAEQLARSIEEALDAGIDGVFTVDGFASLLLDAAERRGAVVGRDLLVVELDDDTDGGCTQRRTTNIALDLADFVGAAMRRLIDAALAPTSIHAPMRCGFVLNPRTSTTGTT